MLSSDHPGNVAFRTYIENSIETYAEATTKLEKSIVVSKIVEAIRSASPEGGFVKKENGRWYEVGDHMAREKVGQRYDIRGSFSKGCCLVATVV